MKQKYDIAKAVESYGSVSRTYGAYYGRDFIDVDSARTIRSSFNQADYDYYRESEKIPTSIESSIDVCDKIYKNTSIVRSVIDMMSDFTVQGIRIEHKDPKVQNQLNKWSQFINFKDISERIANMIYRVGNAPVYIIYGKANIKVRRQWSKGDMEITTSPSQSNRIPLRYRVLFPNSLKPIGMNPLGKQDYGIKITTEMRLQPSIIADIIKDFNISDVDAKRILNGADYIPIPTENIDTLFYKKDSWSNWALPMIHSIIDPIFMLNKLKLCDKRAADGILSQVRLWTLGDYDRGLYPEPAAINKLRTVLGSIGGGDTTDIIWGPELKFTESKSNAHEFLKPEKYEQTMREIYAGLGVPPGLTGNENNGSASNNDIAMKTLVERLEYGRRVIIDFWQKELDKLVSAFGWNSTPIVTFDYKVLSDEHLERKLLIDLWDRDIISNEKLRHLCRQDNKLEEMRVKREGAKRESGKIPMKASPYHNPNAQVEYNKILLNSGLFTPKELGIKTTDKIASDRNMESLKKDVGGNGRPFGSKDEYKRKRTTKAFADLIEWATLIQDELAQKLNPIILQNYGKSKLPALTKDELDTYETVKASILSNMEPFSELTDEIIASYAINMNDDFKDIQKNLIIELEKKPTVKQLRKINATAYAYIHSDE